ncbi:sodium-dependent bicarbonate transport family permease [Hoyosella rhizosphaerae]|uniref:Sodium-dependent bicarbonate transport family permease n=1 Tax=Hoyosella rhizosphaerae TaxID=1755582 RepID=A0A916X7Y7_9ACTN|nr:sodium-dependent bicarbonate transport family permease [Hoyosella rhizosphaerae]MBN4927190.1 sodium-dependent bicarbonate transport family permease [Hoyosella rhizosphaerae]GGC53306.1 sodium-dependent bicarbonate transport family permease [Hoyosella rhizosphaerae]
MPIDVLSANLASPALGFFALGVIATRMKSDLSFPEQAAKALSIYLLIAIGFKGGVQLRAEGISSSLALGIGAGLFLAVTLPLVAYLILRSFTPVSRIDAAAVAAHYGSVSVVTFVAATAFLSAMGESSEGFMITLLAAMEVPAILIGIYLARRGGGSTSNHRFMDTLTHGPIVLLIGAAVVGAATGEAGMAQLEGFLVTPFLGVLALFLLDMGIIAARRLGELRQAGLRLLAFGMVMPLIGGTAGVLLGTAIGLSVGGATLLAVLGASASYVAAPAAIREAVPEANPALSLGLALGVTFPFNLIVGIPLFYTAAQLLA